MKAIKSLVGGLALFASVGAFATPVTLNGEAPDLQTVINKLYKDANTPLSKAPDVNKNQATEFGQFEIEASGGSVATMIIEVTSNSSTNTFGIYDIYNPNIYLELFSGAAAPGGQVFLSANDAFQFSVNGGTPVQFNSTAFGYYVGTQGGAPKFYSQASRNGGDDLMVAFQGDNDYIKLPTRARGKWGESSYILAWEDTPLSRADKDYQDMVVYVESVTPVPEPGTAALLGLAGLCMAFTRRKKASKDAVA